MKTRCKFQVQRVTQMNWKVAEDKFGEEITLSAVCDDKKDPENASFAQATPTGELKFTVSNPEVCGTFKPGACFYVDLVPAV